MICKLSVPFEKIEVDFQMVDGDIPWRPTCISYITKLDEDKTAVAAANLMYEAVTDKNNHFYDVEHGSVLSLSQTTLHCTRKRNTFMCNSTIRWRFQKPPRPLREHIYIPLLYTRDTSLTRFSLHLSLTRIQALSCIEEYITWKLDKLQTTTTR